MNKDLKWLYYLFIYKTTVIHFFWCMVQKRLVKTLTIKYWWYERAWQKHCTLNFQHSSFNFVLSSLVLPSTTSKSNCGNVSKDNFIYTLSNVPLVSAKITNRGNSSRSPIYTLRSSSLENSNALRLSGSISYWQAAQLLVLATISWKQWRWNRAPQQSV